MYCSRAVLWLGGRAVTAGNAASRRCSDPLMRRFSVGSACYSEKTPPENDGTAATPAEEKADAPRQDNNQGRSSEERLLNLFRSMKVNVSSQQKFQAVKSKSTKDQKPQEMQSASQMFQMASEGPKEEKSVSPELEAAASAVAETFPEKKTQVESELLQQLRLHKQQVEAQRKGFLDISNVISGMKVEKSPMRPSRNKPFQNKENLFMEKRSLGLFTARRLQKFPIPSVSEETAVAEGSPNLWDIELANELAAALGNQPRNAIEEMITWTKEGKLWAFPIDNEAGLDEEQSIEFHEHVFLEKYLEDFPKTGPLRHFMELVVCGLSKNPFITVQQKKEHIEWFRDYFNQKEEILKESDVYLN